jgi:hypothetical protein
MKMPTGIQMIKAERRRQITKEKWTAKHDDQRHADGTLSEAAGCYYRCAVFQENCGRLPKEATDAFRFEPIGWPWEARWFKLGASAIRTYVKAGALFQAEIALIERLRRKDKQPEACEGCLRGAKLGVQRIAQQIDRLLK